MGRLTKLEWVREVEQDAQSRRVVSAFGLNGNRELKITIDSFNPDADANLVVAAPKLLQAIKLALPSIEARENRLGFDLPEGIAVRAAIAKAEGSAT